MDWKQALGILLVKISDAILVKKCHDDFQNKITETVLKTARKPVKMLYKLHTGLPNTASASSEYIF